MDNERASLVFGVLLALINAGYVTTLAAYDYWRETIVSHYQRMDDLVADRGGGQQ